MVATNMLRRDAINAILCALGFAIIFLLMKPFVETPYLDDFSYAFTVKRLLQTGHLIYNGWSAPLIITQSWWGWAWCKALGGFSFINLRLSIFPLAAASVALCYILSRRAGLREGSALFATILLAFSPLFLPLSMSFMTDVPALFFTLLALYTFSLSENTVRGIIWLGVATLASIVGGMSRQAVWIAPLAVIPYLAWLHRRERAFLVAAIVAWSAVIYDIIASSTWFSRQPDVILSTSIERTLQLVVQSPKTLFNLWVTHLITTLLIIIFPATFGVIVDQSVKLWNRRKDPATLAIVLAVVSAIGLELHFNPSIAFSPWLPDMNNPEGTLNSIQIELSGTNPFSIPSGVVIGLSACSIVAVALIAASVLSKLKTPAATARSFVRVFCAKDGNATLPIILIFSIVYCGSLATRAAAGNIFDRYLLPMLPCAVIAALLSIQRIHVDSLGLRAARWFSTILLIACSAYGLASMQQLLAVERARNQAIALLENRGVAPTAFAAGHACDAWTQVNVAWLNRYEIRNRTHRYDPNRGIIFSLACKYRIEYSPTYDTRPSDLPAIEYHTWLPTFRRKIYIDLFRYPWWLDAKPAGNHPAPRKYWEDILIN